MPTDATHNFTDKKRVAVSPLEETDSKKTRILSDDDATGQIMQMSEEQILHISNILKSSF